jgi:hypothetical protein
MHVLLNGLPHFFFLPPKDAFFYCYSCQEEATRHPIVRGGGASRLPSFFFFLLFSCRLLCLSNLPLSNQLLCVFALPFLTFVFGLRVFCVECLAPFFITNYYMLSVFNVHLRSFVAAGKKKLLWKCPTTCVFSVDNFSDRLRCTRKKEESLFRSLR